MVRPEREFTARSNQAGRYQRSLRGRTVRSDQRRHQSDQIDPHDHHHADYGDPVLPERLCGKTPLAYAAALQFGPARHVEHGPSPCAEQAGHDRQRRNLVIQRSAPAGGEPGPASQEHRQKCDPHHQTQAAHAPPSRHKLRQPREYGGNSQSASPRSDGRMRTGPSQADVCIGRIDAGVSHIESADPERRRAHPQPGSPPRPSSRRPGCHP